MVTQNAFFVVTNMPSLANFALPLGQKTGLLSLLLSQYVTINGESDITLSDGSSGHSYSITVTADQLHRLNVPIDKGFDGVLITTKQQGVTYMVVYAAQLGRIAEFENTFQNILNSLKFGSVSFSSSNTVSTNNNQVQENNTEIGPPSTDPYCSGTNSSFDVCQQSPTSSEIPCNGNMTENGCTNYVDIVQGSSSPENEQNFVPQDLDASVGTTIIWTNDDTTLHTVTSGSPEGENSGTEFDSSYIAARNTFQHTFSNAGTFDYYCTLHPFMKGKITVS